MPIRLTRRRNSTTRATGPHRLLASGQAAPRAWRRARRGVLGGCGFGLLERGSAAALGGGAEPATGRHGGTSGGDGRAIGGGSAAAGSGRPALTYKPWSMRRRSGGRGPSGLFCARPVAFAVAA